MAHTGDRLALLYRLSQTFNSSLDLDEVLNRVMDEVIAAVRAERGFVMLRGADGQLAFRAARGLDQQTIEEPKFHISRGVVERVAQSGQPVLTSDAQTDQRLNLRQSVMALGLRSILCVPLQLKTETIGVVYVDNRLRAGVFTQSDLELLAAIASSAAVAIENARLYQVAVEKGRLERELQVARGLQAALLPRETPRLPGWEFAAHWQPAREVAGDYFDFIPAGPDRMGLLVADVTDKGMPAALFMALVRSTVRASLAASASPAEGLAHANRLISADSPNSMFVTLGYVQVAAHAGDVLCVNAGHNPVLVYHAQQQFVALKRTGFPLGVMAEAALGQHTAHLEPGDWLVLYTDGIIEALNASGEEFGLQRLQALLEENAASTAAEAVAAVRKALNDFTGSATPFDDVTLLLAKRL